MVFVLFCGGLVGASGDAILVVLGDVQVAGVLGGQLGGCLGGWHPKVQLRNHKNSKKALRGFNHIFCAASAPRPGRILSR